MNLSERCVEEFDPRDWVRGQQYFKDGSVSIVELERTSLLAEVQGSQRKPYEVYLDWANARRGRLDVKCTCPRFEDIGLCKHVAAVIVAADADGAGSGVPGRGSLLLEPLDPDFDDLEEADDSWDDSQSDDYLPRPASGPSRFAAGNAVRVRRQTKSSRPGRAPDWKQRLAAVRRTQAVELDHASVGSGRDSNKPRQIWYLLDLERSRRRGWPCVSLRQRVVKKDGTPGKLKVARFSRQQVDGLPSEDDRALIGLLAGNESDYGQSYYYNGYSSYQECGDFAIAPSMLDIVLPRLAASGRFGWLQENGAAGEEPVRLLTWDHGDPWKLHLELAKAADGKHWQLQGTLQRGEVNEPLASPLLILSAGLVVFADRIARFDAAGGFEWVAMLRQSGPMLVPVKQQQEFVEQMVHQEALAPIEWPAELRWTEQRPAPEPRLTISKPERRWETELECSLAFQYGDRCASFKAGPAAWYDRKSRCAVRRDLAAEAAAAEQLVTAGAHRPRYYGGSDPGLYCVAPAKMPQLVSRLAGAGWQVEAEGRVIRSAGEFSFSVTSGVDWFDLEGRCDFAGVSASLPQLLAALRKGERFVRLDDGSQGMLPDEWLARYGRLAELGQAQDARLRFSSSQGALLDALLAAQETQRVRVDKTFARLREKLRSFDGIRPRQEPRSFVGELRPYQREGLSWLHFLDEFGFGGCLADDMGLGKTVQVLALLEQRRQRRAAKTPRAGSRADSSPNYAAGPSLVVVPRSLVFNWLEEARRFAPKLRVLNYTGLDRSAAFEQLAEHDLVITTYGTLRRDIARLGKVPFDYAILDEAQAIKNASSQAAKACRLLQARRRLAMTGTPVENHLGELWSLFEFLNPGMLGKSAQLSDSVGVARKGRPPKDGPSKRQQPQIDRTLLARALRPFLLRRTKQQVLADLPEKTEQTVYCELDVPQRKAYDELREHYRRGLLERVKKLGIHRSQIHVLEALLRLRQAACHPGLLDPQKVDAESAKLKTLLAQLGEVLDENHKVLVFSQFTSLLSIVRRRLDQRKIVYEYLDGKTTNRQAKVERFQTDPACRLFLISLKAGGQGLNLTAADYVFILDPWWNPAVEAQAVDRAHRLGQQRPVFAYRLIARDTVEEKIVQLQQQKRDLADAIITADNSPLRNLTAEDLQLLLG